MVKMCLGVCIKHEWFFIFICCIWFCPLYCLTTKSDQSCSSKLNFWPVVLWAVFTSQRLWYCMRWHLQHKQSLKLNSLLFCVVIADTHCLKFIWDVLKDFQRPQWCIQDGSPAPGGLELVRGGKWTYINQLHCCGKVMGWSQLRICTQADAKQTRWFEQTCSIELRRKLKPCTVSYKLPDGCCQ